MAQIGSKVLDWLDLPIQTAMGWPQLTMEGNRRLRFENHRGIREYGENRVRILSDLGVLCIEGEQLEIRVLGKSWIVVEGIMSAVRFEHHEQAGRPGGPGQPGQAAKAGRPQKPGQAQGTENKQKTGKEPRTGGREA